MKRSAGVLLPVFSLPSRYGAGCFSREAYDFIDRLREAGQHDWQILPLNPAGRGNSPYMSDAGFAGNPYCISPDDLAAQGLLTESELDEAAAAYASDSRVPSAGRSVRENSDASPIRDIRDGIDYAASNRIRDRLYRAAFRRWAARNPEDPAAFRRFREENAFWLRDACLFPVIRRDQNDAPWAEWPKGLRDHDAAALDAFAAAHTEAIRYREWLQYEFQQEWTRIRHYAKASGIGIIGDLPIYVALESADCWANPGIFQLDADRRPEAVSGCPPDAFSAEGQLWGNPLYDWDGNTDEVMNWWIRRIHRTSSFYDITRIDHFRGLASYYSIPADADSATEGKWRPGPGMKLFRRIREELGNVRFIAEDLGFLTEDVYALMDAAGYPGMKVLQFAFDGGTDNPYLPANYATDHTIVYTGTHDNDTTRGWYAALPESTQDDVSRTLAEVRRGDTYRVPEEYVTPLMIRLAMHSRAELAIIPFQDWLNLGSEARLNTPGTAEGNWRWQMAPDAFTPELAVIVRDMTAEYGRL